MWLLKLVFILETLCIIEQTVVHCNPWCDRKYDCRSDNTGRMCKHTMCTYENIECGDGWRLDLTDEERALILDMHNKIRAKVANGNMPNQPGATNMMRMEWDNDAEKIAQRWSSQCMEDGHDDCRDSWTGESTGQNVAGKNYGRSWGSQDINRIPDIKSMFNDQWIEKEVVNMHPNYVSSYPWSTPRVIGHYTQAVWAKSTRIGCGLAHFSGRQNGMFMWKYKLVCNYIARGNFIGQPVYLQGVKPATQCPNGAGPSKIYPGLCEFNKKYNDYRDKLANIPEGNGGNPIPTQQPSSSGMKPGVQIQPLYSPKIRPLHEPAKSSPRPPLQPQPSRINTKPAQQPSYSLSSYLPDIDWSKLPLVGRLFGSGPAQPTRVNSPSKNPPVSRPSQNNQEKSQVKPKPAPASPGNEYSGPKDSKHNIVVHYTSRTSPGELSARYTDQDTYGRNHAENPYELISRSHEDFLREVEAQHADAVRRFEEISGMPALFHQPRGSFSPYSQPFGPPNAEYVRTRRMFLTNE